MELTIIVFALFFATFFFVAGIMVFHRAKRALQSANELSNQSSEEFRLAKQVRSDVVRLHRQGEEMQRDAEQSLRDAQTEHEIAINERELANRLRDEATLAWKQAKSENRDAELTLQTADQVRQQIRQTRDESKQLADQAQVAQKIAKQSLQDAQGEQRTAAEYLQQAKEEKRESEIAREIATDDRNQATQMRDEAIQIAEQAKTNRLCAENAQRSAEQTLHDAQIEKQTAVEERQNAELLRNDASRLSEQASADRLCAVDAQRIAEQSLRDAQVEHKTAIEELQKAERLVEQVNVDRLHALEMQRIADQTLRDAQAEHQAATEERQQAKRLAEQSNADRLCAEEAQKIAERSLNDVETERKLAEENHRLAEATRSKAMQVLESAQDFCDRAEEHLSSVEKILGVIREAKIPVEDFRRQTLEDTREFENEILGEIVGDQIKSSDKPDYANPEIPVTPNLPGSEITAIVPIRRGGGPRGPREGNESSTHTFLPEIVCWQRERDWILAVELPEDIGEADHIQVLQNHQLLEQDISKDNCWYLRYTSGTIEVSGETKGDCTFSLDEHDRKYLLFKLIGDNQKQGRLVQQPSSGAYLIVVPTTWKPDNGGFPENVSLMGYSAYYRVFEKGDRGKASFNIAGKAPVVIQSKAEHFSLTGNRVSDATEYLGPLFGYDLPIIHGLNGNAWDKITTIVIGEEGRGRDKWRTSFTPTIEGTDARIPVEKFTDRQGGWYFIRFYNAEHNLIESLDFRFVRGLESIAISPNTPLPPTTGHPVGVIEFYHNADCQIRPTTDFESALLSESWERGTRVLIPAEQCRDRTNWLIVPRNGNEREHVGVTVQIERIWWIVDIGDKKTSEWTDKPIQLSRDDFRATSERTLWLLFPRPRWADLVRVGFPQAEFRQYEMKMTERILAVPLREFESSMILNRAGTFTLEAQFEFRGVEFVQSLGYLTVQVRCQHCDFATLVESDLLEHIEENHLVKLFRSLTYQEYHDEVDSSHPAHITRCGYAPCTFYAASNGIQNSTDEICKHIRTKPEHGGCKFAKEENGVRHIFCREVKNLREIEELLNIKLREAQKCTMCNTLFKSPIPKDLMAHLVKNHRNKLYVI